MSKGASFVSQQIAMRASFVSQQIAMRASFVSQQIARRAETSKEILCQYLHARQVGFLVCLGLQQAGRGFVLRHGWWNGLAADDLLEGIIVIQHVGP